MKKLIYFVASVAMIMLSACGSKEKAENSVPEETPVLETFDKKISGNSWVCNIDDAFKPCMGIANFAITKIEGDSVDFTMDIPVKASNTDPVTGIESITCSIYCFTDEGNVDICEDAQLAPNQEAVVLEMCKEPDPMNEVMVKFSGKTTKALIDTLAADNDGVGYVIRAYMN